VEAEEDALTATIDATVEAAEETSDEETAEKGEELKETVEDTEDELEKKFFTTQLQKDDEADDDRDNEDQSSDGEDTDDGDDDKSSWSPEDYWYWFVPIGAIALIGSIGYCVYQAQTKSNRAKEEEAEVKAAAKAIAEDGEKKTYGSVPTEEP